MNYPQLMVPDTSIGSIPSIGAIDVSANFLWIVFAIIFVVTVVITVVLLYHWIRFSFAPAKTTLSALIYLMGTGAIVAAMFIATSYYQLSIGSI